MRSLSCRLNTSYRMNAQPGGTKVSQALPIVGIAKLEKPAYLLSPILPFEWLGNIIARSFSCDPWILKKASLH